MLPAQHARESLKPGPGGIRRTETDGTLGDDGNVHVQFAAIFPGFVTPENSPPLDGEMSVGHRRRNAVAGNTDGVCREASVMLEQIVHGRANQVGVPVEGGQARVGSARSDHHTGLLCLVGQQVPSHDGDAHPVCDSQATHRAEQQGRADPHQRTRSAGCGTPRRTCGHGHQHESRHPRQGRKSVKPRVDGGRLAKLPGAANQDGDSRGSSKCHRAEPDTDVLQQTLVPVAKTY